MSAGPKKSSPEANESSRITTLQGVSSRLALHHFGGVGPPLVLSHATGFHARTYLPLVPVLRSAFDVWGVDLRGHGHSRLDEAASFVWHDFAEDLLAAVAEIRSQRHLGDDESIYGFGHSMGATTILLAEQKRPGTFNGAWLFEPIVFPLGAVPRNSMMAAAARKRRADFPSRAAVLERYASRPPLNKLRADSLSAYVNDGFHDTDQGTVTLACKPAHEAMTFDGANIQASTLADLALPVVIAQGETISDQPSAADFAAGTAAVLTNSEHLRYGQLGHFGPLEAPDRIASDVVDWFRHKGLIG